MNLENAIKVAQLLVTAAEGLTSAIDKAKHALESGTAQLKDALAEAEKMRDQLATDRKEADTALDRKFDKTEDPQP
jgi:ABC-type transporter Mla subunit MlaD